VPGLPTRALGGDVALPDLRAADLACLSERTVDVEEAAGQHRRGLRAQALPPGRVGPALEVCTHASAPWPAIMPCPPNLHIATGQNA